MSTHSIQNYIGKQYVYYPRLKDDLFAYAMSAYTPTPTYLRANLE